jgi:hypothetical protein
MTSIFAQLDKLGIKRKQTSIKTHHLTKDTVQEILEILNDVSVQSVTQSQNSIDFTLDPIIEAEWILREAEVVEKSAGNPLLIGFHIPAPGQDLNATFFRILYSAQYILNSREYLGHDCVSIGFPNINCIETGYLLLWLEHLGENGLQSKKTSYVYFSELVSNSIGSGKWSHDEALYAVTKLCYVIIPDLASTPTRPL